MPCFVQTHRCKFKCVRFATPSRIKHKALSGCYMTPYFNFMKPSSFYAYSYRVYFVFLLKVFSRQSKPLSSWHDQMCANRNFFIVTLLHNVFEIDFQSWWNAWVCSPRLITCLISYLCGKISWVLSCILLSNFLCIQLTVIIYRHKSFRSVTSNMLVKLFFFSARPHFMCVCSSIYMYLAFDVVFSHESDMFLVDTKSCYSKLPLYFCVC